MKNKCELNFSDLRCICDPKVYTFKNTSEIEPLDEVIGQERAVNAIDFGLHMKSPGYNIFVTGIEGTGKSTIIRDIVNQHAKTLPTPIDWCMVNNFKDEYRPKAICMPTGKATLFSKTMSKLIEDLKKDMTDIFASKFSVPIPSKKALSSKTISGMSSAIVPFAEAGTFIIPESISLFRLSVSSQAEVINITITIIPIFFITLQKYKFTKAILSRFF